MKYTLVPSKLMRCSFLKRNTQIFIDREAMVKTNNNLTKNMYPSNRQLRVAELIRRSISDILARNDLHEPALMNKPITVSEVKCTTDLKLATIFVLPLGGKNAEEVVKSLAAQKNPIRKLLGKAITLKFVPDLRFLEDKTFDQMDKTTLMLNNATVRRDIMN